MLPPLALISPDFARYPRTVITVPTGRESLVKPRRYREFGAPASISQVSVVPSSASTSMVNQLCGLMSSTFVIVPSNWIGLVKSYSAENA